MTTKKFTLRRDYLGRACAIEFDGETVANLNPNSKRPEHFARLIIDALAMMDHRPNPNAREIIREYLLIRGYDGMGRDSDDCACLVDDLAWCGSVQPECYAGYRVPCETCDQDFRIVATKGDTDDRE